jgi:hypothetical protein
MEKEFEVKGTEREYEEEDHQKDLPSILEVINIEELAVDGICGIY